jgi:hypothetical protein
MKNLNIVKCLAIIALVAVIGFSMVACGDDSGGGGGDDGELGLNKKTVSGTIELEENLDYFEFILANFGTYRANTVVTITTDLPPYDNFTLGGTNIYEHTYNKILIRKDNWEIGQVVHWTATSSNMTFNKVSVEDTAYSKAVVFEFNFINGSDWLSNFQHKPLEVFLKKYKNDYNY